MGEIVKMDNGKDNEIMAMMNDASLCPLLEETKVGVSNYTKLPVTRLAAMGTAFQPLTTAVQTAVTGAGGSGLYYVNTAGKTMFQMKETGKFIGSLKTSAGLVGGGQAQMMPLAFDPTMLFMAATLANIDKKLDSIKEMQQEMMYFLVQKEKAELKGNLTFLYDVFNNYKYNWNNEMYKNSNHTMVLVLLERYGELLINDGMNRFGYGCHESQDEIMLDKYNVITIYSQQLSNYSDFFEAHGIKKVESLITAWDTFSDETPGQAERCDYKGKSVYDLPEELKDRGMYLADTRAE